VTLTDFGFPVWALDFIASKHFLIFWLSNISILSRCCGYPVWDLWFIVSKHFNYLAFQYLDIERT
jgi:hypothetical protein